MPRLDIKKALSLIQPDGALSRALKGFEPRIQQQQMMEDVLNAYNEDSLAIIEAGTGTGKSVAYLIPAILWSLENKERTLISTNTIALQEQLIKKDIPLITKALKVDIKAVIVKGMSNYICKRKLEQAVADRPFHEQNEVEEIEKIEQWEEHTLHGSRSDLPFAPSPGAWEKVCAENDTCTHRKCPHFKECHFFKARQEATDANILIANHHMLFADLAVRQEGSQKDPGLLPSYRRVILDEAHNIEDVATEFLASRTSNFEIRRHLGRLSGEKQGKLLALYQQTKKFFGSNAPKGLPSLLQRLEIDLPGQRTVLYELLQRTFDTFYSFLGNFIDISKGGKLRLLPKHPSHESWEDVAREGKAFVSELKKYIQSLHALMNDIENLRESKFVDQIQGLKQEILALANRLDGSAEVILSILQEKENPDKVKWLEAKVSGQWTNISLTDAELEVSKILPNILFNPFSTTVLCSATLATNKDFNFIRERLGILKDRLEERPLIEKIYDSPFNYKSQALLVVPTDLPQPHDPQFTQEACKKIWHSLHASNGNAFVLFTSYSMLKECYNKLFELLKERGYTVFKQGDDNRHSLLNAFKEAKKGVLFGTDSFWEGVDVAGDALRLVIIVKLPFQVPTEPIIEARTEAITKRGGSAFMEYSVPNAIVKFKQGFGRLIRHKKDRGCIVCLDSRLTSKQYGKLFINSLPSCQESFGDGATTHAQMLTFYKKRNP